MNHHLVIKLAAIIILGAFPSLAFFLILPKVKQRWQSRLRRARLMAGNRRRGEQSWYYYEDEPIELERYSIGDITCRYNAHSPYIRCAVNPSGPCRDCPHYESK